MAANRVAVFLRRTLIFFAKFCLFSLAACVAVVFYVYKTRGRDSSSVSQAPISRQTITELEPEHDEPDSRLFYHSDGRIELIYDSPSFSVSYRDHDGRHQDPSRYKIIGHVARRLYRQSVMPTSALACAYSSIASTIANKLAPTREGVAPQVISYLSGTPPNIVIQPLPNPDVPGLTDKSSDDARQRNEILINVQFVDKLLDPDNRFFAGTLLYIIMAILHETMQALVWELFLRHIIPKSVGQSSRRVELRPEESGYKLERRIVGGQVCLSFEDRTKDGSLDWATLRDVCILDFNAFYVLQEKEILEAISTLLSKDRVFPVPLPCLKGNQSSVVSPPHYIRTRHLPLPASYSESWLSVALRSLNLWPKDKSFHIGTCGLALEREEARRKELMALKAKRSWLSWWS